MNEQITAWRSNTPGCAYRIHLNNAGSALMPRPVLEAVEAHVRLESEIGGYEAAADAADRIDEAYDHVGRLVGAAAGCSALGPAPGYGAADVLSATVRNA